MDGGFPVGEMQRLTLIVGDGDQPELAPTRIDAGQVLHIQTAVQGRQGLVRAFLEQREVDHVGVEVDDVELVGAVQNFAQHRQVGGEIGFQRRRIQADGLITHRHQAGLGLGVGAGEKGHVVAQIDQGVGQMRHHTLRTAIQLGRHGLIQRGDLRDFHGDVLRHRILAGR